MQEVAHLFPLSAEPDVAERLSEEVPAEPEGEHPLVRPAELPRAGDDAAPVDERGQAVLGRVLLQQELGRELGGAVERAAAVQGEGGGNALFAGARRVAGIFEPRRGLPERKVVYGRVRVDPRR